MAEATGRTIRQERTRHRIDDLKARMKQEVMEAARLSPVSSQTKKAMEKAYRWYVCGRRVNLTRRFTDEQRFFMELFLVSFYCR